MKIRHILFLLITLYCGLAFPQSKQVKSGTTSQNGDVRIYKMGSAIFPIFIRAKDKAAFSYSCTQGKVGCEALKAMLKVENLKVQSLELGEGKNPGAQLCKTSLAGQVVILQDLKGHEDSFCQFGDGSLLASATIARILK